MLFFTIMLVLGLILLAGPAFLKVVLNLTAAIVPLSWGVEIVAFIVIGALIVSHWTYRSIIQGKTYKKHQNEVDYIRKKCYFWDKVNKIVTILALVYILLVISNPLLVRSRDSWTKVINDNPSGFSTARIVGIVLLAIGTAWLLGGYFERRKYEKYYVDEVEPEEPARVRSTEDASQKRTTSRQGNHVKGQERRPETRSMNGQASRPEQKASTEDPVTDRDLDIEIPKI